MKLELVKIDDINVAVPYDSDTVDREVMVPTTIKQPIKDVDGKTVSIDELTTFGYKIKYTPDESVAFSDYTMFTALYTYNQKLVERVTEYESMLMEFGLDPTVTHNTESIESAIDELNLTQVEKHEKVLKLSNCFHDILVNVQAILTLTEKDVEFNDFILWSKLPVMISLLPSKNPTPPEGPVPIFVDTQDGVDELTALGVEL